MPQLARHLFTAVITASALLCGFLWLREEVTNRIYQQKLEALVGEYAALADRYNYAVRQTAITELEVTNDSVTVLIRTLDGEIRRIPTPFDPRREIYIDYLVGRGKIWIRRVFDQKTSPDNGLVIDPVWDEVDWKNGHLDFGKAVYRAMEPGIWSIQVSGSGGLTLEKVRETTSASLEAAPLVRTFEEIKLSLDAEVKSIGWDDIWNFCTSPLEK
ncbi:MAG: hypothetical protein ACO3ZW_04495 [Opitutales bacterium]|jgi:hypothetical protein